MVELKAHVALLTYRVIGFCLYPVIPFYLFFRAIRGKEEWCRKKERLGKSSLLRPQGSLVWLHAASVGETLALVPLINHILSLKINVLLTTGTVTSSSLVRKHFGNQLIHQYAPLDLDFVVRRFIRHWKPDLVLVCESEIWPLRIKELAKMRIPQILVNAHMSERSFKAWQKRRVFAKHIFKDIDLAISQNERDVVYYHTLGVKSVMFSGNLKADVFLVEDQALLARYRNAIGNRPVWAAISTHEGEEEIAFEVHKIVKNYLPDLLTIIVPRHPERVEDLIKKCDNQSLRFIRRSRNAIPDMNTDILWGDTIGEMGLFLRLSKVSFVGKSLCEKGGHNPLELALLDSAILTGPHVSNFQEMFEQFLTRDAAYTVQDTKQLAIQVYKLLTNEILRKEMVDKAHEVAKGMAGALDRTLKILDPFLQPLVIQTGLRQRQGGYAY
ncbi:lipid IV(A) 3-deoxy-D-manno-octulosonic acid transferase [Bartonella krasnovii]|uniref:3-deoxy-D-manno-octulosonic acid transferase n=1 Tax=Bartonella krasnovii TaxID=2267275 RepID=A0A5B9CZR4_9HYPH|nr:lipid IV(A) 3-deoxy-D-manno-octulosonic acid transferase [Bartonella krasnovii]QEE11595.1 3-deoxy-D-manno-octulosonic acid transferase [Bartonella krasnovii]UNF29350.1 lipid IV(A) 3-deoxy-D-manno-octulosonic acid transferase [Bartonella krasnovii]UNF35707.1 lipid IV(A) 3-deoxy-D-manno-octulosonic acid transferase [Bartonella krasnovii]UNF37328.1 lipid IV(A) 3-deoxy-D-manno-octulosonic acid transferase [Bartonella krasnovii]UNF39020.1 lipid IV(A) 3-deoxy-D-manno-octulosonic acid transferase 